MTDGDATKNGAPKIRPRDVGVPAFTGTVSAPTRLTLTAPGPGTVMIVRGMEVPVSWTAGQGSVDINLSTGQTVGGRSVRVTCNAPAASGGAWVQLNNLWAPSRVPEVASLSSPRPRVATA